MSKARAAAVVACLVLAAGCTEGASSSGGDGSGKQASRSPSPQQTGPITVKITPADNASDVAPHKPVKVTVSGGEIASVTVKGRGNGTRKVTGDTSADGTSWRSSGTLVPSTSYTVSVQAKNDEREKKTTASFQTLQPRDSVKASVAPLDGSVVGVGQPIGVYLSKPVKRRAAVERALQVKASRKIEGGWYWFSPTELRFRPKTYWPAHTKVTLNADLAGVKAGPGLWGVEDRTIKFAVGERHYSRVDAKKHRMVVRSGGKVVKRMPVSTGNAKYPTKSGVHVVMGKSDPYKMDSTTAGITGSDAYLTTVRYAVRLSNSGEFVHAAPWSVSSQGRRNVSHGCVNVSTVRAQWFYQFSQPGDIVDVVGTKARMEPTNGFGDWNLSWAQWKKGSALS